MVKTRVYELQYIRSDHEHMFTYSLFLPVFFVALVHKDISLNDLQVFFLKWNAYQSNRLQQANIFSFHKVMEIKHFIYFLVRTTFYNAMALGAGAV